jgi:FkbM family methyltransferase
MIRSIARNLVSITRRTSYPYAKWVLVAGYAKVAMAYGLSQLRLHSIRRFQEIRHLSAVGLDFWFFSYSGFIYLFEEIFIRQDYVFVSRRPDPLIIDCGSNMGMSILYFKSRYPKARIIGFEPDPATFEMLQKNVAANALSDVALHNCALANRAGTADLYRDSQALGSLIMSLRKERSPKNDETKKIQTVLLSDYIKSEVDFLKLDIEGMEMDVIEELVEKRKLTLVREMTIEYHHHLPAGDDSLSRVLALLESSGFGYHISTTEGSSIQDNRDMQDILVRAYRK